MADVLTAIVFRRPFSARGQLNEAGYSGFNVSPAAVAGELGR